MFELVLRARGKFILGYNLEQGYSFTINLASDETVQPLIPNIELLIFYKGRIKN